MARDLHQRLPYAIRVASKLHCRRICEVFTLPTNSGLDQITKKCPNETHDDQAQSEKHNSTGIFGAAAIGTATKQVIADNPEYHDAVQDTDQAYIDAHVAMQDMAELVRNHAL